MIWYYAVGLAVSITFVWWVLMQFLELYAQVVFSVALAVFILVSIIQIESDHHKFKTEFLQDEAKQK